LQERAAGLRESCGPAVCFIRLAMGRFLSLIRLGAELADIACLRECARFLGIESVGLAPATVCKGWRGQGIGQWWAFRQRTGILM